MPRERTLLLLVALALAGLGFYAAYTTDISAILRWMDSVPPSLLGALFVAMLGGLPYIVRKIGDVNRISAAERFLETQHLPAGQDEVDGLIALAAKSGQRDAAMQMFADIRRQHGHDGLRKGHVMWVLKQLTGEIPTGAVAPAFRATQPTEPT